MKILSLTSKDFASGIAPYKNDARFGLMYSASGYNPSLFGGDIAFTKEPVRIGNDVVVDKITGFANVTSTIYGVGDLGHFYKITDLSTTPTVTDLKSATQLTNPVQAIFTFKTKIGTVDYVYYLHNSSRIGQLTPSTDTFNDTFISLSASTFSGRTPFFIAEDRVYFGTINTLGMIYDDVTNANPAKSENVLNFPKGEFVESISGDDTYLIISTSLSNEIGSKIYFWDYKNNYVSWVKEPYRIPDTIYSMKTISGVTYALGTKGLWALTFSSYPVLIREDITSQTGYTNQLSRLRDLLILNGGSGIMAGYGKINNFFKTGLYKISSGYSSYPIAFDFLANSTRALISDLGARLYYVDYTLQKTASSDVINTSYIKLDGLTSISRVDLVFADKLASGDSVAIRLRSTSGSTDGVDYQDYTTISYVNNGAVNNGISTSTNKLKTDYLSIELTVSGTCVIKSIDIYGERTNRTN